MKKINIEISLFGAFRNFSSGAAITLQLPQGTNLTEIRQALFSEFVKRDPDFIQQELINRSALADEREILRDDYILQQDTKLAILPPVCGG